MLDKIEISVVIPCYNCSEYIEKTVDTLLKQTIKDKIEIILVDDGSDSDTKRVLKKLESSIEKLLVQKNQGQSTARNIGLSKANGKFVVFVDSDDYVSEDFCEVLLNNYSNEFAVVTCSTTLFDENGVIEDYTPSGGGLKDALYKNIALGTSLFLKDELQKVGGYDVSMRSGFEDWEMLIRLLKVTGKKVLVVDKSLYYYRKGIVSTTEKANERKFELWQYIYSKHQDLYIEDYNRFLEFWLNKVKKEEQKKIELRNSVEYKIGTIVLKPFRIIKKIFNG